MLKAPRRNTHEQSRHLMGGQAQHDEIGIGTIQAVPANRVAQAVREPAYPTPVPAWCSDRSPVVPAAIE